MRNIFFLIPLIAIFSSASFAGVYILKCDSETPGLKTEIIMGDYGEIDALRINGKISWKFDIDEDDQAVDYDVSPLIKDSGMLLKLKKLSKVKDGSYVRAKLKIVTPKTGADVSTEDQLDIVSDDGAGIAFLQFINAKNQDVGNALWAGWAGFYFNCR